MEMTIYSSNTLNNAGNCSYPKETKVTDITSAKEAFSHDYVCAKYKDNYRSNNNFISANIIPFDIDNDHTEIPSEWVTSKSVAEFFTDVPFVVHYSRNNMKEKNGKLARPKFHIIFLSNELTSPDDVRKLKERVYAIYPFVDKMALDAGRFLFGTRQPDVEFFSGSTTLDDFVKNYEESTSEFEKEIIPEGKRNKSMYLIAVKLLKRYGNTEESRNKYKEESIKCTPSLSHDELNSIWKSALKFYEEIKKEPSYVKPEDYKKDEWLEIIPLDDYKLPTFPIEVMPDAIKNYCKEIAESTQTPIDMSAVCALGILSLAMQSKYKIVGKEDWEEQVSLYLLIIAEPSDRKSAVLNQILKVIRAFEANFNSSHDIEFQKNEIEYSSLLSKKAKLVKDIEKGKATQDDLDEVLLKIHNFKKKCRLKLIADDITPEALATRMDEQGGSIAIVSSEGGVFDIMSGTYSNHVNIDILLKSYSGDSISVDRIGRQSLYIDEPKMTILLMAQPKVLENFMSNDIFSGRGFTARFLYSVPKTLVGSRAFNTKPITYESKKAFQDLIESILNEKREITSYIHLSTEASKLLEDYFLEFEKRLATDLKDMGSWAGKLVGNILRISALVTRSKGIKYDEFLGCESISDDAVWLVSGEDMKGAIAIGNYFLEHAIYAFNSLGGSKKMKDAKKVLDAILKSNPRMTTITPRNVLRLCKSIKDKESAYSALEVLENYGYLRLKEREPYSGKGRPTGISYEINPASYEDDHPP